MSAIDKPRCRKDFKIAIICAKQEESDAVEGLFDEFWKDYIEGIPEEDPTSYTMGRIGNHPVVLAFMGRMGKKRAASLATSLNFSFPGIKLSLVVGICGGVPTITRDGENIEVLLGDIIISTLVVQYDSGYQMPNDFFMRNTLESNLGPPNDQIQSFLAKMQGMKGRKELKDRTYHFLNELLEKEDFKAWKYPGADKDRLYEPDYRHKHQDASFCNTCARCTNKDHEICESARSSSCDELGCNPNNLVPRNRLKVQKPQLLIHFGRVASGDTVMKSGHHRDKIASETKLVAFEMEGARVWSHSPTIVIKSVYGYSDSHKNDRAQKYAAASAAACAKRLLEEWRPTGILAPPKAPVGESISFPETFV